MQYFYQSICPTVFINILCNKLSITPLVGSGMPDIRDFLCHKHNIIPPPHLPIVSALANTTFLCTSMPKNIFPYRTDCTPVVLNWDASPRLFCQQLYRQTGSAVYSRQSKERRLNLRRQGGAVRSQRIYILCSYINRRGWPQAPPPVYPYRSRKTPTIHF